MNLATAVLGKMLEIEEQTDSIMGWDSGVAMWNVHADEDDLSDLSVMKMGGPEYLAVHPVELIRSLTPPPACTQGLLLSFEGWYSPSDFDPPDAAPDRTDIRWLVAALRNGTILLLTHIRGMKPRIDTIDKHRLLTLPQVTAEVCANLRDFVIHGHDHSHDMPPIPQFVLDAVQRLMGTDGVSGVFIIPPPGDPDGA